MTEITDQVFLGNSVMDYIIAVVIFLVSLIVIKIVEYIILKKIKPWIEKSNTSIDDFALEIIQRIFMPLASFGAFYLAITSLALDAQLKKIIDIIAMAILAIAVARFIVTVVDYSFKMYCRKRGLDESFRKSLGGILNLSKFVIWGAAIVFFLDNLGFKITAVITGLGIGGVAVALAAQAVLGDLFSYFSILFDRPFEIGDFIIVGDFLGVVEKVGIKTTRISSLSGEQLIFSNSDLTNSRIRNYKRMQKRRVVFKLGVVYQTPLEKLKEIPGVIENIIKGTDETIFDRAHFLSYGDFSLIYEIVYYVQGGDYNKYMDIQQKINFAINDEFAKRDIEFAYPTQTLFLQKQAQES